VVAGFNRLDAVRAEMLALATLLRPDEVGRLERSDGAGNCARGASHGAAAAAARVVLTQTQDGCRASSQAAFCPGAGPETATSSTTRSVHATATSSITNATSPHTRTRPCSPGTSFHAARPRICPSNIPLCVPSTTIVRPRSNPSAKSRPHSCRPHSCRPHSCPGSTCSASSSFGSISTSTVCHTSKCPLSSCQRSTQSTSSDCRADFF
jgi:hypothetical protein